MKTYLLHFHWNQAEAKHFVQRRQQKWEHGRVHSWTVDGNGRIVDVSGIRIGAPLRDILRMVDIHREVVAPQMPLPQRGQVEHRDGCEKKP